MIMFYSENTRLLTEIAVLFLFLLLLTFVYLLMPKNISSELSDIKFCLIYRKMATDMMNIRERVSFVTTKSDENKKKSS